ARLSRWRAARSSCRPKPEDQRNDDGGHGSRLFDAERNFNERTAYDVLVGTAERLAGSSELHCGYSPHSPDVREIDWQWEDDGHLPVLRVRRHDDLGAVRG